jgi:hypothetical protein
LWLAVTFFLFVRVSGAFSKDQNNSRPIRIYQSRMSDWSETQSSAVLYIDITFMKYKSFSVTHHLGLIGVPLNVLSQVLILNKLIILFSYELVSLLSWFDSLWYVEKCRHLGLSLEHSKLKSVVPRHMSRLGGEQQHSKDIDLNTESRLAQLCHSPCAACCHLRLA